MVLAVLVGWLLQQFAGLREAMLPAIVIGFVVASFVPVAGACPVPRRPPQP